MRTAIIFHENDLIDSEISTRWLTSFSDLAGMVVLREDAGKSKNRIRREIKRVGYLRFLDVLAFRAYYRLFHAGRDNDWRLKEVERVGKSLPAISNVKKITAANPNLPEVKEFLESLDVDIVIARCKVILKSEIFSIPKTGTFVLHPGICPEYRNAHGCFWAIAENDLENVGLTLLKVDQGIDTGPTYGYYKSAHDLTKESHIVIQNRVFTENLDELRDKLIEVANGTAEPLDTTGRHSGVWGQPWLTKYFKALRNVRASKRTGRSIDIKTNGESTDVL